MNYLRSSKMAVVYHNQDITKGTLREIDSNIYFNFDIVNDTDQIVPATTKIFRTQSFIENPSDYELAVVRFLIPALNIPIVQEFRNDLYSVKLEWDGFTAEEFVALPIGNTLWNYGDFVDAVNTALINAHTALLLAKPLLPQAIPPRMVMESANGNLISVWATLNYDTSIVNNTKIIFNNQLAFIFPTLSYIVSDFGTNNPNFQVKVIDRLTNIVVIGGDSYYVMSEVSSTLYLLNDFKNIRFESDTIPINPEIQSSSTNITKSLLTDFEGIQGVNDRTAIQYFPQGALRWIDLKSSIPIKDLDLRVYWTTKLDKDNLVLLPPYSSLTMKLLFRKKFTNGSFGYT